MNMLIMPFALFAILGAEDTPAPKMPLGKDTTYFTEPVDKEGYIDYQAALNERLGKGVTPESNADVLLWKAIGPTPDRKHMPEDYFKLLGINEPSPQGDYFIGLYEYLKNHAKLNSGEVSLAIQQQVRACRWPWKEDNCPQISGWLKINEKPLAVVIEATLRPHYFSPLVPARFGDEPRSLIGTRQPSVQMARELVRALTARSMLRLGESKFDEAWHDLLACHRLGRLIGQGATVIEALVGVAIDGIASDADVVFLDRAGTMKVRDRLRDLQALPPMPPVADKIDLGERTIFLDSLQLVRRGARTAEYLTGRTFDDGKPSAAYIKALDAVNWTPHLQRGNRWYDRAAAAMRLEGRTDREQELAKIEEELKQIEKDLEAQEQEDQTNVAKRLLAAIGPAKPNAERIGKILIQMHLPSAGAAQAAFDRNQQVQRNVQVAFALGAYFRDHERYPDKLDSLIPKYLAAVPDDLFADKPLLYRPAKDGYLLYSVGINGQDDEGRWYSDDPRGDDPRVRLPLSEPKWEEPKKPGSQLLIPGLGPVREGEHEARNHVSSSATTNRKVFFANERIFVRTSDRVGSVSQAAREAIISWTSVSCMRELSELRNFVERKS